MASPEPTPPSKRCSSCGVAKPLTDFHRNRTRTDGHQSFCKTCQRATVGSETNTARSRARNRAINALIEAHRDEFNRLYQRESDRA